MHSSLPTSRRPSARSVIERSVRALLKPRDLIPIWKWSEQHVRLEPPYPTPFHGAYDSATMPYVREPQEEICNPYTRVVVFCCDAQHCKTENIILNPIRFTVGADPAPTLIVMPAGDDARSFSEARLQPSLKSTPPCAEQIPADPDLFKLSEMHLKNCTLTLVGAGSPGKLASRPIKKLFCDEVDKWEQASSREASPLDLAMERVTAYHDHIIVMASTPTIEGGAIWQELKKSDWRRYFVPCPRCNFEQYLEFRDREVNVNRVCWPKEARLADGSWDFELVRRGAWYECRQCGGRIEQHEKAAIIQAGHWKKTQLNMPPERVGFHINRLYSPHKTWGDVAVKFLEAHDNFSALQNVVNSWFAEIWKLESRELTEARLADVMKPYALGTCPTKPLKIIVGVDVQEVGFFYIVRAFGAGAESWLLDYGHVATYDDVKALGDKEFPIFGTTETMRPWRGLIDSGYDKQGVYEFCHNSRGFWHPVKGWESKGMAGAVKSSDVKWYPSQSNRQRIIRILLFDDHSFTSDLFIRRLQNHDGPRWWLPGGVDDGHGGKIGAAGRDYIKQLLSMELREKRNERNATVQYWHQKSKADHYKDCEKIALVGEWLMMKMLTKKRHAEETATANSESDIAAAAENIESSTDSAG